MRMNRNRRIISRSSKNSAKKLGQETTETIEDAIDTMKSDAEK